MNRRGFLGALAATAAAFALDPERALWVPGAKTISIPKPISKPTFFGTVYDPLERGYKVGDTILIRKPVRFEAVGVFGLSIPWVDYMQYTVIRAGQPLWVEWAE